MSIQELLANPPCDPPEPDYRAGLVLASHGILGTVEFEDGTRERCAQLRGKEYAIVGDRVWVGEGVEEDDESRIMEIWPRERILQRKSKRETQRLCANIDRLLIVSAVEPPAREGLIDRYLATAESQGFEAFLIINKLDLPGSKELLEQLDYYRDIGLEIRATSAEDGRGVDELRSLIMSGVSAMAGHSGVGKSSLINALLGPDIARTGEISEATGRGKHVTTTAVAYRFGGGLVVDTPGIRSFSLAEIEHDELRFYFREIEALRPDCKFGDCLHIDEPGCAVLPAVEAGTIARHRYDSYLKLRAELEKDLVQERAYLKKRHPD